MIASLEVAREAARIGLRAVTTLACAALALSSVPAAAADDGEDDAPVVETATLSGAATRVAQWIATTDDNDELPYMIVDKDMATVFLFDAEDKFLGDAPILIGIAPGDEATPGVGSKDLNKLGPAEKTTPAGRYLAKYGRAVGRQRVLWIDYATSVALHAVPTGNKKERRRERLLSMTPEDNRITYGCINVPDTFYGKIRPQFQKSGGIVYVLPDTKPLEVVFPRLRVLPFLQSGVTGAGGSD